MTNGNTAVALSSPLPRPKWRDIRGPDNTLLCRFDPDRFVLHFKVRGRDYYEDLTKHMPQAEAAVIENDPISDLRF